METWPKKYLNLHLRWRRIINNFMMSSPINSFLDDYNCRMNWDKDIYLYSLTKPKAPNWLRYDYDNVKNCYIQYGAITEEREV